MPAFRLLLLLAVSLGLSVFSTLRSQGLSWAFAPTSFGAPSGPQAVPKFDKIMEYASAAGTAHSAAIRPLDDGFSILWFDGTEEAHSDVVIKQSTFRLVDEKWVSSPPENLLVKEELAAQSVPKQSVWTLGNVITGADGNNTLFATIVSVGGWAAASITKVGMDGTQISDARKLSLSPMLNRSHLVRAPVVPYSDGTTAIPAYFEMGKAFAELIRLDDQGRVRDKRRITHGRLAIQPMIVPLDDHNAVALMRNFDKKSDRLVATWTADGGRNWTIPELLSDIPNPNAPVAALLLSDGQILMAFNDSATDASILKLALSKDQGKTWKRIKTLENGNGSARYPAMHRLPDGDILLTYSHGNKRGIRAFVFNEAWVFAQ